jgi:hypothetical protein
LLGNREELQATFWGSKIWIVERIAPQFTRIL